MVHPKKILIIRFSSIGDIVLTTSFLSTLKTQFPGSEVHFMTLDSFSSMLENQKGHLLFETPYLDYHHNQR